MTLINVVRAYEIGNSCPASHILAELISATEGTELISAVAGGTE